ncbi:hypothetical protein JCM11251_002476 [Rhodosporidiobolus azoricus]
MSVHPLRRPGPLPSDLEFAALDHSSSGWSAIEQLVLSGAGDALAGGSGGRRDKGKGKEIVRPGEVEIVPTVRMGAVEGLDGEGVQYGPFTPPQKAFVPLWLAVHLKKKRRCRIVSPQWLSVGFLEQVLKQEQTDPNFSDLPRDYLEVSKVLLEVASDDVPAPDRLRLLLKDIREARQAKVREGLAAVNAVHLAMPNLSTLELSELRPFFSLSFSRLSALDPLADIHAENELMWMKDPVGLMERARRGEVEGAAALARGANGGAVDLGGLGPYGAGMGAFEREGTGFSAF